MRGLIRFRSRWVTRRYSVNWPGGLSGAFRIVFASDFHVCAPWTTIGDLERLVDDINALGPDIVVIGGDIPASPRLPGERPGIGECCAPFARLKAPLGVFGILGNHDWWSNPFGAASADVGNMVAESLGEAGAIVLQNRSVAVPIGGGEIHLVGLDSQNVEYLDPDRGFHDPDKAFADVPPGAPAILLAHEPDFFAQGDTRAFLQLSGHTHGGQVNLFGWRLGKPTAQGALYPYGHYRDGGRHLIVSGGVGFSKLPVRIGQPPELTVVDIGNATGRPG